MASWVIVKLPHQTSPKGDYIPHEQKYTTRHGLSEIPNEVHREIRCQPRQPEVQQEPFVHLLLEAALGWYTELAKPGQNMAKCGAAALGRILSRQRLSFCAGHRRPHAPGQRNGLACQIHVSAAACRTSTPTPSVTQWPPCCTSTAWTVCPFLSDWTTRRSAPPQIFMPM